MNSPIRRSGAFAVLAVMPTLVACDAGSTGPEGSAAEPAFVALASAAPSASFPVAGTSVHYVSTAIVHSQQPTAGGEVQRSTEIVRLEGDVNGYVLYHPTSVFDFTAGTLVNTGTQIFSGTVAGSGPVILHDADFRFDVDLATGETLGRVHLGRSNDAPHPGHWFECDLEVVDTGVSPAGDFLGSYTGTCTRFGRPA